MASTIGPPDSIDAAITNTVGFRLAVIGDSMSVQNHALGNPWPVWLGQTLNQNGVKCDYRIFGVNSDSYYRAINNTPYNGISTLQAVINYKPDYVIVALGHNDTVNPVDSRSLSQVQSDATSFYSQLKTALPNATVYYGATIAYDTDHFTTSNLKNKGIAPGYMTLRANPDILEDSWSNEILEDNVETTKRTELSNFEDLDTAIKALGTIDGHFNIQAWKVGRLGLTVTDLIHFNEVGHRMLAASVLDGLRGISSPIVDNLVDQLIGSWQSFNTIFSDYLTTDGVDGWTYSQPNDDLAAAVEDNLGSRFRPESWYLPYKSQFKVQPDNVVNNTSSGGSVYEWYINGSKPNTAVTLSVDGGSYTATGFSTDENGYAKALGVAGALGVPDGAHVFRFKVGNMSYLPTTVTFTFSP